MRAMSRRASALLLLVLATLSLAAVAQKAGAAPDDSFIAIPAKSPEQKAVLNLFEQYARAVLARDFVKAHSLMIPEAAEQVSADALRGRYVDLEGQYGELKKIKTQGLWIDKASPSWRIAFVVVAEEHEWRSLQLAYILRQDSSGWRVVGFHMGGATPGGNFEDRKG
jgi:hypothetical protein